MWMMVQEGYSQSLVNEAIGQHGRRRLPLVPLLPNRSGTGRVLPESGLIRVVVKSLTGSHSPSHSLFPTRRALPVAILSSERKT